MKIAIAGKAGAGKTAIADYFIKKYSFIKFSIATKIKALGKTIRAKDYANFEELVKNTKYILTFPEEFQPVEENLKKVLSIIIDFSEKNPKKEEDVKDRRLLQEIGRVFRKYFGTVWILTAVNDSKKLDNLVIDDMRFQAEFETFKEGGFLLVRVDCDYENRIARMKTRDGYVNEKLLNDVSEVDLDNIEFPSTIDNNGSFEYLYEQLDEFYKKELKKEI